MTTFEHAMLGINGALAAGLHRNYGWKIAALTAIAAVSPEWDGLPILFSIQLFDQAHRVWGHNLLACVLLGLSIGSLDYRFDLVTRVASVVVRRLRLPRPDSGLDVRRDYTVRGLTVWLVAAVVGALSQLPADMVVSGTDTLADWELQPFWPFSDRSYVFALVPWGDPGISIVFSLGMFAMLRWRSSLQRVAIITLVAVVTYLAVRGIG